MGCGAEPDAGTDMLLRACRRNDSVRALTETCHHSAKMLMMSVEFKVPSYRSYALSATRLFNDSHSNLLPHDIQNQLTPHM